jgi:AraC-like DNA-binding protein
VKNIFLPLILFMPFYSYAQSVGQQQKDSLRSVIATARGQEKFDAFVRLSNIYYFEATRKKKKRDTLMAMYDEIDAQAAKEGNVRVQGIVRINRLNILTTTRQYDEVVKLTPAYLQFMEKHKDNKPMLNSYYIIYATCIDAYRNLSRTDEATVAVNDMYQHAKEHDNNIGMGLSLFSMGRIYNDQERYVEQEKCLREAIVALQDSALNKLTDIYLHLGQCLIEQERYEEALQLAGGDMESTIKRYEAQSGSVLLVAWLNQYMTYISAYAGLKQYDNLEIYCDKVEHMSNGSIIPYAERAMILASRKQYAKALEMVDKAIETAFPKYKLAAMKTKMEILLHSEGSKSMEILYKEIVELQTLEHNKKMNAQLDAIRTRYEVDKITAENERNQIEKIRNRNYFLFAFAGCILLTIALVLWMLLHRIIARKNRGLFRQIKEQDALLDSLRQTMPTAGDVPQNDIAKELRGNLQQRKLVLRLHDYLLQERRFACSEINFDRIINALATNRSYFYESVKIVTGQSPVDYIRAMQLGEAKKMLETTFDMSVPDIVDACGFPSRSTFYRLFRERYQISPADYRKIAKEKA